MNTDEIKRELEDTYKVGFDVNGTNTDFCVTLEGTRSDKFKIVGSIKDNIRLNIVAEPEKYGANFLRLINYSDKAKRYGFTALMNEIDVGNVNLYINNVKQNNKEFVENQDEWSSFVIRYTLIPFDSSKSANRIVAIICGMMLSLIDYSVEGYEEGKVKDIHANKYERNPINREICLASKGYTCCICGFNFERMYGEVGKKTIEVHHMVPVSHMGDNYVVKPLEELVPVCSNCHSIIHKRKDPYTVDEVKSMIFTIKNEQLF